MSSLFVNFVLQRGL